MKKLRQMHIFLIKYVIKFLKNAFDSHKEIIFVFDSYVRLMTIRVLKDYK